VLDVRTGTLHTTGLAHKGAALFCTTSEVGAPPSGPPMGILARAAESRENSSKICGSM